MGATSPSPGVHRLQRALGRRLNPVEPQRLARDRAEHGPIVAVVRGTDGRGRKAIITWADGHKSVHRAGRTGAVVISPDAIGRVPDRRDVSTAVDTSPRRTSPRPRGAGRPAARRSSGPRSGSDPGDDGEPGEGPRWPAHGLATCPICTDEPRTRPRCASCNGLGFVGRARRNRFKATGVRA